MEKLKIAVLMGGKSEEHEISLLSGKAVASGLDSQKYDVLDVVVSREGKFPFRLEKFKDFDVVFIALHGPYGEDGSIQSVLDHLGVTYTGSKALASALGLDKAMSRLVWQAQGLETVPFKVVKDLNTAYKEAENFGLPVVVKPRWQGSSIGVHVVKSEDEFEACFDDACSFDGDVLVEPFLKGVEVACGVLGNDSPRALVPVEIVPVLDEFYSYKAKYKQGGSKHIIPPRLPENVVKQVQDLAIKAYEALGCRGFARVDMFVIGSKPLLLEINTIPGFTSSSLFPEAAKVFGIEFGKLLDLIINYSLER